MKKTELQVGEIYNLKHYKTLTVPVKIVTVGNYRVEVQYLSAKTLEPIAVPNPRIYGATTEAVMFAQIKDKYEVGVK
jgi:hypothetical protein